MGRQTFLIPLDRTILEQRLPRNVEPRSRMSDDARRDAMRGRVRRHDLRLGILALVSRGVSLDSTVLQRDLPGPPTIGMIEYHLSILRLAELLDAND